MAANRPKLQLKAAAIILTALVVGGTIGFHRIEGWGVLESLYMTVITLSTVGYGEVRPLSEIGRLFTIFLIVGGVGTVAYSFGTISRIMVEGYVRQVLGRRRLQKMIHRNKNHYIICGYGRMGSLICRELAKDKIPVVVVEKSDRISGELSDGPYPFIKGDATRNEVLVEAGIDRAAGLVSVVSTDAENVYIVLTARGLNKNLNIVARASDPDAEHKLLQAGANRVVSPYVIGGIRIAQAVLRPAVVDFIELATTREHLELQMEEIVIPTDSPLAGKTLVETRIRDQFGVIVVSVLKSGGHMDFNPSHKTVLSGGDTIIVLGERPKIKALYDLATGEKG